LAEATARRSDRVEAADIRDVEKVERRGAFLSVLHLAAQVAVTTSLAKRLTISRSMRAAR